MYKWRLLQLVDDGEVLDLGDKYPYFKGNGNCVMVNYEDETVLLENDDEEIQLEARDEAIIKENNLESILKYIPKSMLSYLVAK